MYTWPSTYQVLSHSKTVVSGYNIIMNIYLHDKMNSLQSYWAKRFVPMMYLSIAIIVM